MKKKIILVGGTASGKSYLMRKLIERKLKVAVKTTTRPIRKNEEDKIDYYFINEDMFNNQDFLFKQQFVINETTTWKYGLTLEEFISADLAILTPGEIELLNEHRKDCFIVYLDISIKTRKSRLKYRNDSNDSIERRLESDEKDFKDFKDFDYRITNSKFDIEDLLSNIS